MATRPSWLWMPACRRRRIRRLVDGSLSYFDTSGRLSTLGKVSGSFGPNEATDVASGQLPNLSNLTLELSNHAGSVQLTLSPSSTNDYRFRVSGGTGSYAAAYGSGVLTITFRRSSNEYLLRLTVGEELDRAAECARSPNFAHRDQP